MAKMVEIDEAEFNRMTALQKIASSIVSKPEARKLLEQAHKMVDPNALTPTLDADANNPVNTIKADLESQIAALKKEREDEKRENTLRAIADRQAADFAKLRKAGYTDEGIAALEKLMTEEGITKVDNAVAIFERNNPPPMPATPGGGGMTGDRWNFTDTTDQTDKDIKALIESRGGVQGGSDQMADAATMRLASAALRELRGGR